MWSVCSSLKLSATCQTMCLRESPASLGPSPMSLPTFVAMTNRSRSPWTAFPISSSELPPGVDVRGVDAVYPQVDRFSDDANRRRLVDVPAEVVGPERHPRDPEAGPSYLRVIQCGRAQRRAALEILCAAGHEPRAALLEAAATASRRGRRSFRGRRRGSGASCPSV